MGKHAFILENSHRQKIKALLVSSSFLLLLLVVGIFFIFRWDFITEELPLFDKFTKHVERNIVNFTNFGLSYAFFLGGIFFVPSPDELMFYYAIEKTGVFLSPLMFSLIGYMLAQILNYYLGLKLSPFILHFISKSKVYGARRLANRYGAYGIFFANFLPLPGPLLTFALGIAKYKFPRLFIITLIGKTCKFLVIAAAQYMILEHYL